MDFSKPLQKIYLHYNFSKPSIFILVSISKAKQNNLNQVHLLRLRRGREGEGKAGYFTSEVFGREIGGYFACCVLSLGQVCSVSLQPFQWRKRQHGRVLHGFACPAARWWVSTPSPQRAFPCIIGLLDFHGKVMLSATLSVMYLGRRLAV